MATLVYIPSGLQTPELEIMLAKTQMLIDAGELTIVATCSGGSNYACSFNIYGIRSICRACISKVECGLKTLRGSFEHIKTPEKINLSQNIIDHNIARSRPLIKDSHYEGIDVGQAAYSSYLGSTRDQNLEGFFVYFVLSRLIMTSRALVEWSLNEVFPSLGISALVIYNGRQNQYRPILRSAQLLQIPIEVMEFSGQTDSCVYIFNDNLPQDLNNLYRKIEDCWTGFLGDVEDCSLKYYSLKRSGGVINDSRSYVLSQKIGLLPKGWDENQHNIAIFNSSEDEFAALGGEYDETLYSDQAEAISKICETLKEDNDIVLWLRIHPNLVNVKWSFAKKLYELERQYSNLHIIPGSSPISTYSLIDACSVAVSFGSTVGVEAAYWGKPSVLIGRCIYESLGSVYVPKSHKEVIRLLRDKRLQALTNIGSQKIAVFWSCGGGGLQGFSGNTTIGFKVNSKAIKFTRLNHTYYLLGKFFEKSILNRINYLFRSAKHINRYI